MCGGGVMVVVVVYWSIVWCASVPNQAIKILCFSTGLLMLHHENKVNEDKRRRSGVLYQGEG